MSDSVRHSTQADLSRDFFVGLVDLQRTGPLPKAQGSAWRSQGHSGGGPTVHSLPAMPRGLAQPGHCVFWARLLPRLLQRGVTVTL